MEMRTLGEIGFKRWKDGRGLMADYSSGRCIRPELLTNHVKKTIQVNIVQILFSKVAFKKNNTERFESWFWKCHLFFCSPSRKCLQLNKVPFCSHPSQARRECETKGQLLTMYVQGLATRVHVCVCVCITDTVEGEGWGGHKSFDMVTLWGLILWTIFSLWCKSLHFRREPKVGVKVRE